MDRRKFLRAAPVACSAMASTASAEARQPQGVHLSIERDSPYFGGILAQRGIKRVTLNGEEVRRCVEASEPDGFVLQSLHQLSGTAHFLREPDAILIPATDKRPARVKRFGVVKIEFRERAE